LLMCGLNQFIDFLISVFHLLQKIAWLIIQYSLSKLLIN
jgi:hypothetical protein